jgi:hypothetical protein
MKTSGTKDSDMDPYCYAHLNFDQKQNGEKTASSINAAGKTGYLHAKN